MKRIESLTKLQLYANLFLFILLFASLNTLLVIDVIFPLISPPETGPGPEFDLPMSIVVIIIDVVISIYPIFQIKQIFTELKRRKI